MTSEEQSQSGILKAKLGLIILSVILKKNTSRWKQGITNLIMNKGSGVLLRLLCPGYVYWGSSQHLERSKRGGHRV